MTYHTTMMGMGDIRDETDLDYCPACGSGLEGEFPVECPECGPVNIDFWPSPWESGEAGELSAAISDGDFEEDLAEIEDAVAGIGAIFDALGSGAIDTLDDDELADVLGVDAGDLKEADAHEPDGIRARINRVLGWG